MDMVTKPETLKWGPAPANLPKGAEIAVLQGDPTKPEHFTIRLKMPSGYAIPAHHHPTMENVTVLSGMLYAGMGDNADKTKAAAFAPGGFASLPAQMNHFAYADTDVVIQVEAEGHLSSPMPIRPTIQTNRTSGRYRLEAIARPPRQHSTLGNTAEMRGATSPAARISWAILAASWCATPLRRFQSHSIGPLSWPSDALERRWVTCWLAAGPSRSECHLRRFAQLLWPLSHYGFALGLRGNRRCRPDEGASIASPEGGCPQACP